jgi:hypothetical protein
MVSSYPEYLKAPGQRTEWLEVLRVLGEMGIPQDSAAARRQLELGMEERRRCDEPGDWCMGEHLVAQGCAVIEN